jgi:hypothetical protein
VRWSHGGEHLFAAHSPHLVAGGQPFQVFHDQDEDVVGRLHDRGEHARHPDRRARRHLAIEPDLALVGPGRFGEVRARLDPGGQLDDHRARGAVLGQVVADRHPRPAAQKAGALADGVDVHGADRRPS